MISRKEKEHIESLCDKYFIRNYNINPNGTVDVNGDVCLSGCHLYELPFNFNKVTGDFLCDNNSLTTLKGSPIWVGKDYDCSSNRIRTLEFIPEYVGRRILFRCNSSINSEFVSRFNYLESEEVRLLFKYQSYYNVWDDGFNVPNYRDLIADIKDGLK